MRVASLVCVFAATLVFGTMPVVAQQVLVRTGEHDGFSRLVVDLRTRAPWKVSGTGQTRDLTFDGVAPGFDVSRAFDRISGARIAFIEPIEGGSGLRLGLNCECALDVFWHGASMLVVDVRDTPTSDVGADPAPVDAASEQPLANPMLAALGRASRVGSQDAAVALISAHLSSGTALVPKRPMTLQREVIDEMRRSIAIGIERAASLGLVDRVDIDTEVQSATVQDEYAARHMSARSDNASSLWHPQLNLGAYTSADLQIMPIDTATIQTVAGEACFDSDFLVVGQWGTTATFAEQIGLARKTLTAEFDRTTPGVALDMARLYVFFGFGVEAIQIVENASIQGPGADAVTAMAQLIDLEWTDSGLFDDQMDCASDVALWSILAEGSIPSNLRPNVDAVLRALADQPDHLKTLLGARVVRIFATSNQSDAAARLLRVLDRLPRPASTMQSLARAETDISTGDIQTADIGLKAVVQSNTDLSAAALARRIQNRLAIGDPVAPEMVDLIASFAREQRDTAMGPEIARAHIGGLAASGRYGRAFEVIGKRSPQDVTQEFAQVVDVVASYTTKNASDLEFLRHLLSLNGLISANSTDVTSNAIARRLVDLGFPVEAGAYLAGPAAGEALSERRLLRARINLAATAPRAAMVDLLGLTGLGADILRAEAYSQLGEHVSAHLSYLSAGQTAEALREALLAEEWSDAKDIAAPMLTKVIGGISDDLQPGLIGTLARNRALLAQSADARANISKLLDADDSVANVGG